MQVADFRHLSGQLSGICRHQIVPNYLTLKLFIFCGVKIVETPQRDCEELIGILSNNSNVNK